MFTVKVFKFNGKGDERVDVYETPHPEVYSRDRGPGHAPLREVSWREPLTDEWPVVVLDRDLVDGPPENGEWVATQVVIENAQGKTTEVVRA